MALPTSTSKTVAKPDALNVAAQAQREREAMIAEIAQLKADNAKITKQNTLSLGIKVSEKGAVSVYGMGRFPVTLYKEQWLKLDAKMTDIKEFIIKNDSLLKTKDDQ